MINTNQFTKSNLDNNSKCFISWYNVVERRYNKKLTINTLKTFILTGKTIKYRVMVYDINHPLNKYNGMIMRKEEILTILLDSLITGEFTTYFNNKYPTFRNHQKEIHLENIQMLTESDIGRAILMYIIMTNYYNGLLYCFMERV